MAEVTLNVVGERLFASAISKLLAKMPATPGGLYLDASDVKAERFGRTVSGLLRKGEADGKEGLPVGIPIISEHRADSAYSCVSAASVVAKVIRDAEMEKIRKELGMTMESMGSGYPSDNRTRGFLENWIKEKGDAPPHARRSWKTVKTLLKTHAPDQKRLTDFRE